MIRRTPTDTDAQSLRGQRIAHLIESAGPGGAERMVVELALAQQDLGARTTVFLPHTTDDWLATQLVDTGVQVERYHLGAPFSWQCVRTLMHAFRRNSVTLAHSHDFSMAVNGACAARTLGVPHVITMHGGRYYSEKWRRRVLLRAAFESSQALVAVSQALGDTLSRDLRFSRDRIQTIPNGVRVDVCQPAPLRTELGIPPSAPILLAVGNLYRVKGHAVLFNAMGQLRPDVHVVIAGRGEEESALRRLAGELGIAKRVHLLGHRNDVCQLLHAADVFVHPSLDEGLPLAVLEAMFAARPIVASDVGDIGRAVGPEGGLVVTPGDVNALAAAINRMLDQPFLARAFGYSARLRAETNYGVGMAVGRYSELYAPLFGARFASVMARVSVSAQRAMRANTSEKVGRD